MAKKKVSKNSSKKNESASTQLWGVFLILVSIMGFGMFGIVGSIIKGFSIFLMGTWYIIALVLCLLLGLYMFFKKSIPNFKSANLIGLYMVILSLLIYSHLEYATNSHLVGKAILENTINNFLDSSSAYAAQSGGGILGGVLTICFTKLFEYTGTKIVIGVMLVLGLILLFNINISNIFGKVSSLFSDDEDDEEDDEEVVSDKKEVNLEDTIMTESLEHVKVYSSMGELLGGKNPPKEGGKQLAFNMENEEDDSGKSYILPTLDILDKPKAAKKVNSTEFLQSNKAALERVLNDFQIVGRVVEIHEGPTVTQFEVEIKSGTKVSRITSIHKEIALALAARDIRIQAPIPGKNTVGVEIPNKVVASVPFESIISRPTEKAEKAKIPVTLGKDIMGNIMFADISKMPHLLVAGSTGSGKSVCINSFIATILMTKKPDEVKLVLVDPKKVELSNYNGIPHLLWPVVTNPKKASAALQKVVAIMEDRYEKFSEAGAKKIDDYNEKIEAKNKKAGYEVEKKMFYMVVIIDELADLMVVASKEVEDSIMRITQMARAAGIHLIVATQRPSTDVITGVVKANIPSRIAFAVASSIDSRTILDSGGAEKLLGKGDMLYLPMGENNPTRIQGCFISDGEIERLINYVSSQQKAVYDKSLEEESSHMAGENSPKEEYDDPLYDEIVEFAVQSGKVSVSLLQRRFKIGYNRAARVVDLLEERGIVGPANGSKPREVLVKVENNN